MPYYSPFQVAQFSSENLFNRERIALASLNRQQLAQVLSDHGELVQFLHGLSSALPLGHPSAHVIFALLAQHLYRQGELRQFLVPGACAPTPPPRPLPAIAWPQPLRMESKDLEPPSPTTITDVNRLTSIAYPPATTPPTAHDMNAKTVIKERTPTVIQDGTHPTRDYTQQYVPSVATPETQHCTPNTSDSRRPPHAFTLRTPRPGSWGTMPRNADSSLLARALTRPLRQIPRHPRGEYGRLLMCSPDPAQLEGLVNRAADASSVPIVRLNAHELPSGELAGTAVHSAFDCARDLVARKCTRRVMVVIAGAERLCEPGTYIAMEHAVRALVAEGIAAGPNISCVGVADTDVPMEMTTLGMLWPYSN